MKKIFKIILFILFVALIIAAGIFYWIYFSNSNVLENKIQNITNGNESNTVNNEVVPIENNQTNNQNTSTGENSGATNNNGSSTTIANPASVNCAKQGGRLVLKNKEDGSQYGLCYFDDNRACEEWAMFRGECPVGGVKTTGFDTIAQSFCAWSGGKTFAVENAVCTFSDGSTCLADDFYKGTCSKGQNK